VRSLKVMGPSRKVLGVPVCTLDAFHDRWISAQLSEDGM